MITDLPERGKASLKDFLQKIERGQIASTLPDDDMTRLQGTKPGAAVYQTSIDNHAGHLVKLHNKTNQKRIGSFVSLVTNLSNVCKQ